MTEVQQGLTPPVRFREVSLKRELSVYAVACARNNLHQAYFTAHLCTSLFLFLACSDNTGTLFPNLPPNPVHRDGGRVGFRKQASFWKHSENFFRFDIFRPVQLLKP